MFDPSTIAFGEVMHFNGEKKFGFLKVLDDRGQPLSKNLFFHFNDGQFVYHNGEHPIFIGAKKQTSDGVYKLRLPQKGDLIAYARCSAGSRGRDKAAPWAYAQSWNHWLDWLDNRPVCRVVCREQILFSRPDGSPEEIIVWEGQNIFELSVKHHKYEDISYGRRLTRDSLGHSSIEDGYVVKNYSFEVQKDGEWEKCDDPRIMLCCVPEDVFRKHADFGLRYPRLCHHNNSPRQREEQRQQLAKAR